MPRYRTNVAGFDVPDNWVDQSITAFRLPATPGGADASFVVTRDDTKGMAPFERYLERQLDQCRAGLPGFTLVRSDRMTANEQDAAWIEFTWTKEPQTLHLRQVFFDCGYFATICTLTTTGADLAYFDPPWRRLMASLVFDRPDAAAVPPDAR